MKKITTDTFSATRFLETILGAFILSIIYGFFISSKLALNNSMDENRYGVDGFVFVYYLFFFVLTSTPPIAIILWMKNRYSLYAKILLLLGLSYIILEFLLKNIKYII